MVVNSKNTGKIVSAAIKLFQSRGYASVMVKDICAEAGVSHSSFYALFTGKDDVLLHVLRGYQDSAEDTMRRLLLADNDLEKLWSLVLKYLSIAENFGPELTGAMLSLELAWEIQRNRRGQRVHGPVSGVVSALCEKLPDGRDHPQPGQGGGAHPPGRGAELLHRL